MWNPAWSVSTILTGLLSFMLETSPTLGSLETSEEEKRQLAYRSLSHNLADAQFCDQFPHVVEDIKAELCRREKLEEEVRKKQEENRLNGLNTSNTADTSSSSFQSLISNLVMLLGLLAFIMAVKYVVTTTPME